MFFYFIKRETLINLFQILSIVFSYKIHFLPNTFKKLSLQKFWFPVYWNEKGIG